MNDDNQQKPQRNIWRKSTSSPKVHLACKIKEECGTCRYINEDYQSSLHTKYTDILGKMKSSGLLERSHILPLTPSPMPLYYRAHAKLAVRRSKTPDSRVAIGLFKPNTHEVVNLDYCPLHKDTINRCLRDLKEVINESDIEPYDEVEHSGVLRYLAIRASHTTDELMVTFVVTEEIPAELKRLLTKVKKLGHKIVSAHMNVNSERGNHIFGTDSQRLVGADRLRESLCDLDFEIGPTSFFQVNPWQAENIYRRIEQLAGQHIRPEVAWDFYCGTGTLSMILAKNGFKVLGIEENPQATRDAQSNVMRNELANQPHFLCGRVEDLEENLPKWAQEPSVILVNPSRRGLAESARDQIGRTLAANPKATLIYLSCEAETFIRDMKDLEFFGIEIRQIEAFDMFPYTEKLEWLSIITSKPKN